VGCSEVETHQVLVALHPQDDSFLDILGALQGFCRMNISRTRVLALIEVCALVHNWELGGLQEYTADSGRVYKFRQSSCCKGMQGPT
jgi:hypothetical protein